MSQVKLHFVVLQCAPTKFKMRHYLLLTLKYRITVSFTNRGTRFRCTTPNLACKADCISKASSTLSDSYLQSHHSKKLSIYSVASSLPCSSKSHCRSAAGAAIPALQLARFGPRTHRWYTRESTRLLRKKKKQQQRNMVKICKRQSISRPC